MTALSNPGPGESAHPQEHGRPRVALVLGSGGHLGSRQIGMARAILEAGITPDVVLGSSVGAVNGAALATDPSLATVARLEHAWQTVRGDHVLGASLLKQVSTLIRTGTHLHENHRLRDLIRYVAPKDDFAALAVPFECVAACIETTEEHWFESGNLHDAVMASCAAPGLLPPIRIADRHYVDGGLVNSLPIGRAAQLGTATIYVLQTGRIDRMVSRPRQPLEVAMATWEIVRRHRFYIERKALPKGVVVHMLPTGEPSPPHYADRSHFRYRDSDHAEEQCHRAYLASRTYLAEVGKGQSRN